MYEILYHVLFESTVLFEENSYFSLQSLLTVNKVATKCQIIFCSEGSNL